MESTFIKSVNIQPFSGTDDEYHADKDHISASRLKKLKISPAHYKIDAETETDETDAMLFGSAYHCYILEPDKFKERYYIFDDSVVWGALIAKGAKSPRATNDYKTWLAGEQSFSDGKILIDKKNSDKLEAMKSKLFSHPYAKMLLSNGFNEQGYMGEIDTEVGKINVKFKPDHINDNKHLIVDLKTTKDATKDGFTKIAGELSYHIQAAFYSDLMEKISGSIGPYRFVFIAQEKKPPYAFNLFECSPQFISQGRFEYEMLLQLYRFCIDNDTWPGYQIFIQNKYGIQELSLPSWAIKDINWYDHEEKRDKSRNDVWVLQNT
jgi:exodeoxyribonuclease VIII